MEEIWKDIKEYEGLYQVSNHGRVKSLKRKYLHWSYKGIILKPFLDSGGYPMVSLNTEGKSKNIKLHLLVWDAFGDNARNGRVLQVDHKDNDKLNCNITNLQLLSGRENNIKRSLNMKKSSRFVGVSFDKSRNKWESYIDAPNGKRLHLGRHNTEVLAAIAYEKAKISLGL